MSGTAQGAHRCSQARCSRGRRPARAAPCAPPRRRYAAGPLLLAGVAIPVRDETKHFKLIGTTGTGKSTAIAGLIAGALARGDRAVITDPDGGYLARFYDRHRGDVILNPFEPDSVKWDPFAEIRELYDVDQLARGLIPSTEDASGA